ncbi:hypothetical protein LEMLEM_LOCUS1624, partial [Lemmus lemmus]
HVLCFRNHHSRNTPSHLERSEASSHISLEDSIKGGPSPSLPTSDV